MNYKLIILLLFPLLLLSAPQKINVQLDWKHQFEFAGLYAAKSQGYYKDIGLDVDFKESTKDINIADKVLESKADFGVSFCEIFIFFTNNLMIVEFIV